MVTEWTRPHGDYGPLATVVEYFPEPGKEAIERLAHYLLDVRREIVY